MILLIIKFKLIKLNYEINYVNYEITRFQLQMPPDFLEKYRKLSTMLAETYRQLPNLIYNNGERLYSDECISQLQEISCSPLYCSADENQLLVKHDREDCHQIISNWWVVRSKGLAFM